MRRLIGVAVTFALAGLGLAQPARAASTTTATPIQHLIVLMQQGHSFDNYFGTYPGAEGIRPGTCLPLRTTQTANKGARLKDCVRPYHLGNSLIDDLDHGAGTWRRQYDKGRMDGFVFAYRRLGLSGNTAMGYYDARDIPFYWNVARSYVLFDHFFSSSPVGTRLNRFYWVAGRPTPGGGEKIPSTLRIPQQESK